MLSRIEHTSAESPPTPSGDVGPCLAVECVGVMPSGGI